MAGAMFALTAATVLIWLSNPCAGRITKLNDSLVLFPDVTTNLESELNQRFHTTVEDASNEKLSDRVNRRAHEYIEMARRSNGIDKMRLSKRSMLTDTPRQLPRGRFGVRRLHRMVEQYKIPAKYPKDLVLFQHVGHTFAASLETSSLSPRYADQLVLYILKRKGFVNIGTKPINRGLFLAVRQIDGKLYLVVAEGDRAGSTVYTMTQTNELKFVQTLSTVSPSDIEFWDIPGRHFLAVASAKYTLNFDRALESEIKIFELTAHRFDIVQSIPTTAAISISLIQDNSTVFLAVAKYMDQTGNTDIDSEIWRYSLQDKKFVLYCRIRTHAATYVKFFTLNQRFFLAVGNLFELYEDGLPNYATHSVVYTLSDGDFVPFQSFKLEATTHWQTYSGPNGEFVLFAVLYWHGLKAFQFNGWRFVEVPIEALPSEPVNDISVKAFSLDGKGMLVVLDRKSLGNKPNVFELYFSRENPVEKHREQMSHWCNNSQNTIANDDLPKIDTKFDQAPKWDSPVITVNGDIEFEGGSNVNVLATGALKSDQVSMDSTYLQTLNKLQALLNRQSANLNEALYKANMAVRKDYTNLPGGRLVTDELSVDCASKGCSLSDTRVGVLNGNDVENFLSNIISLDVDLRTEHPLRFSSATVRGNLQTDNVAGLPVTSLVNRVTTKALHRPLVVTSQVSSPSLTAGSVDGVIFSPEELLLLQGDQKLKYPLRGNALTIRALTVSGKINGVPLNVQINPKVTPPTWTGPQELSLLTVNNLEVNNIFGGKRVLQLVADTLKIDESIQNLNSNYKFEKVETYDMDVGTLSGVNVQDIVDVSGPSVYIPGRVSLTTPVSTPFLEVSNRLGAIPVKNGRLQILSTHGTMEENIVTGTKTVERLVITDSVNINGTILGMDLNAQQRPPVIEFNQPLDIPINVTIRSLVNVVALTATDFVDSTGRLSLMQTLKHGVRLDTPELPPNIQFEGNLNVGQLVSEQINGVDPRYWISDNQKEVRLTATKIFKQGLSIEGSSDIFGLISGVNLTDLDSQAVKRDGIQLITGHKTVDSISAYDVWSNDTWLGTVHWRDVLLSTGGQTIRGVSHVDGTMIVKGSVAVYAMEVDGSFGGITLKNLLDDTVFHDGMIYRVTGPKKFLRGFEIESLVMDPKADANLRWLPTLPPVEDSQEVIERNLTLRQPISVRKLVYHGKLDGVDDAAWNNWLLTTGDQVALGVQYIQGQVKAEAGIKIGNGFINQVNVSRLLNDAVRTDMPAHLGRVNFEGGVRSYSPIGLGGTLGGLNIAKALLLEPQEGLLEQNVNGSWSIGLLEAGAFDAANVVVAGEKLTDLCDFASKDFTLSSESLEVKGSVAMEREPYISAINGESLTNIFNRTWLRDMSSEIFGPIQVKGTLNLEGQVFASGTVDGVVIKHIAQNYFSLTKEAPIFTPINFKGGVVVPNARLASLTVNGLVNGQDLTSFALNVLRNDIFQEITGLFTFEAFHTSSNLSVLTTINGLDFSTDVMRTDRPNVMTRPIVVRNSVNVVKLNMPVEAALHGVDIEMWFRKAVRTTGNYTITGKKILKNPRMSGGVIVSKLVNGVPFDTDHLLVTNGDQTVTGRKIIDVRSTTPLRVENLDLKGLLNGVPIGEFLRRSAKRNGHITFTGPLHFSAPLHAFSAQIDNMYHGVNISQLVLGAGAPVELEEFRKASEQLLRTASRAVLSLKSHAFYLNNFHLSQTFNNTKCIFPLSLYNNHVAQIAVVHSSNGYDMISRYTFDDNLQMIIPVAGQRNDILPSSVYLIKPIHWRGYNAFYWETNEAETTEMGAFVGHIIALTSEGHLGLGKVLRSRYKAEWMNSFNLGGRACIIRGSHTYGAVLEVFCSNTALDYVLVQTPDIPSPTQAAHLNVDGEDHVFISCSSDTYTEGTLAVLRWDPYYQTLNISHTFPVLNATAVDAISYSGVHFVAVASGRLDMKPHPGMVDISRFDPLSRTYAHWLSLEVEAPIQVKFAVLPSDELVLYVLTEHPTKSFVALLYRGLAGFKEHTAAAVTLGDTLNVMQTLGYKHLVTVSSTHGGKAALLNANFKGVKYFGNSTSTHYRRRRNA